jgi:toxin-antitoxin system PIN domain toxin
VTLSDVNLLIYAVDSNSPRHDVARRWLEDQLSGVETFAFAWSALLAFVRLTTNAAVFQHPLSAAQALDHVDEWLAQPSSTVLHPTDRHAVLVRELLEPLGTAGNLVADAHLAALAIEHGATLASSDHDFGRFPRLRWIDPLAP